MVQAMSNEFSAELLRRFHPLRVQHWALSDLNPWLAWVGPAAEAVRQQRHDVEADHPLRQLEQIGSEIFSASLDLYRGMRDAATEAAFFGIYANMYTMYLADRQPAEVQAPVEPRELPFVKEALAAIAEGGYTEAVARAGYLLMRKDETAAAGPAADQGRAGARLRGLPAPDRAGPVPPHPRRAGDHRPL
jgi:hypothetical protein